MDKKMMGAMCVMCCAVPLTTLAISSGLFASLAVMFGSQGLGRGLLFIAAFSMIGIAAYRIDKRDKAKNSCCAPGA